MEDASTLVHLFLNRVAESADEQAIRFVQKGEIIARTWNQLASDVFKVVAGLTELGVQPGERVAHLAENRYEWIVTDLAIQSSQAIHVPMHAPLAAEQVLYQIEHSGARAILLSGAEQWSKLQSIESALPVHLRVIAFDAEVPETILGHPTLAFQDWLAQDSADTGRELANDCVSHLDEQSLGTILYTSGTTGQPKGVMLTHRNLVSNAEGTVQAFGMTGKDVRLNFLPLSHIFARTCDLYTWLVTGSELCLATSRESVMGDCQWSKPTLISGVPYFYDRIRRYLIEQDMQDTPGVLQGAMGGNIQWCCSGGAALPDHVFDFYAERDVPILQGYGLTESSPVISVSSPNAYRRGASGLAIQDVEVKINDAGEIITRGPHVMKGYWQDPEATSAMIHDGWLHTGDLGHIDEDGFVYITGRSKELIVTAAGKNIAPVLLESLLTEDPLIEQALVIGDGKNFLVALIVPSWEQVRREIPDTTFKPDDRSSRTAPEIIELYERQIATRLSCVSYHEQVRKFVLLDRPFSIEKGEMTPKLSLRRTIIAEHFADEIEGLYKK